MCFEFGIGNFDVFLYQNLTTNYFPKISKRIFFVELVRLGFVDIEQKKGILFQLSLYDLLAHLELRQDRVFAD